MVSQISTSKQITSLLEKNRNLCEISLEYPTLKQAISPRHLCTCTESSTKPTTSTIIHKLTNQITSEDHEKNSNKHSKTSSEQIELINLCQYHQDEEIPKKFYRKTRYQSSQRNDNDGEEIIDNRD